MSADVQILVGIAFFLALLLAMALFALWLERRP